MNLFDEIKNCINTHSDYVITMSAKGCYLEGICSVESFSLQKIVLMAKTCRINILGEGLQISKLVENDVGVSGKIMSVELEKI